MTLSLATWRISSLLVNESGPFGLFAWIRYWVGVQYNEHSQPYATNDFAELFTCLWCFSVWVGIGWAVLYWYAPLWAFWLALPFALSAVAIALDELVNP